MNTTPVGHAAYIGGTSFGFKITLTRQRDKECQGNFWFNYHGELYEAIVGDKRDDKVTVDGLCKGRHGGTKIHIRRSDKAAEILTGAGYQIEN